MSVIYYQNQIYSGGGGGGRHTIYSGTTTPASNLGLDGDMYFRLDANDNMVEEYIKLNAIWTVIPRADAVLNTKTITENGIYSAQTDSLDGYSSVEINIASGGSCERLFVASENSSTSRNTDHTHIAYYDDTYGTITEDEDFGDYLSYNSSTKKFEVLQEFDALFIPWTYNYRSASSTYSSGSLYINNTEMANWQVGQSRSVGYFRGLPVVAHLEQGDTFYSYTPSSNGFPEQNLKVYKVDSSFSDAFLNIMTIYPNLLSFVSGYKS